MATVATEFSGDLADDKLSIKGLGTVTEWDVDQTIKAMTNAENIIIVPGYGMVVARCQSLVVVMTALLREKGKNVRIGIHPSAG